MEVSAFLRNLDNARTLLRFGTFAELGGLVLLMIVSRSQLRICEWDQSIHASAMQQECCTDPSELRRVSANRYLVHEGSW